MILGHCPRVFSCFSLGKLIIHYLLVFTLTYRQMSLKSEAQSWILVLCFELPEAHLHLGFRLSFQFSLITLQFIIMSYFMEVHYSSPAPHLPLYSSREYILYTSPPPHSWFYQDLWTPNSGPNLLGGLQPIVPFKDLNSAESKNILQWHDKVNIHKILLLSSVSLATLLPFLSLPLQSAGHSDSSNKLHFCEF